MNDRDFWRQYPDKLNEARLNYGKPCPYCQGDLVVRVNGVVRSCICFVVRLEAQEAQTYRAASHVTAGSRQLTFDGLRQWGNGRWATMQAAINSLRGLVQSPWHHRWVKVTGTTGCGKTHLVLAAYNKIDHAAIYAHAGTLATRIHEGLEKPEVAAQKHQRWLPLSDLKELLVSVPVLILDDLGTEHDAEFVNTTISDIVALRYEHRQDRPTVVTSNLLEHQLLERYPRLASRLHDAGLVLAHDITLPDYRDRTA